MTWHDKAHEIIARLCLAEFEKMNRLPDGRLRRKHVPYQVPDTARDLVRALGTNDEELAKSIMMFRYDVKGNPQ